MNRKRESLAAAIRAAHRFGPVYSCPPKGAGLVPLASIYPANFGAAKEAARTCVEQSVMRLVGKSFSAEDVRAALKELKP